MLLGLVRPDAGDARVLGVALTEPSGYLGRVGALIESPAFYPGLSGERNLAVQAILGGLDLAQIPAVLERVGLEGRGADRYKTYSLGMKQRLGIAAALLGQPDLLVLDEPTNGLDPTGIREMRILLGSLADDGPTVLVSSHLLSEVQQMCDWLIAIDHGRRVFQGPTSQLLSAGGDELVLGCQHLSDVPRLVALLDRRGLHAMPDGDRLRVRVSHDPATPDEAVQAALAEINQAAMDEQITLVELTVARATLEDRYLDLMSKSGGTS
jgi:ABC-2 type transport system ATP-binding protein